VPDFWETYDQIFNNANGADYNKDDLQLFFDIGTAADPEEQPITITYDVASSIADFVSFTDEEGAIKMAVDMKAFYASDAMSGFDSDLVEKIKVVIDDGELENEVEFEVKFTGKKEYAPEEDKAEEEEEEVKEETADASTPFIPVYEINEEAESPKQN